ncbi:MULTISPECIES: hypothetical protein [Roseomonadaceae]|uniref:Uncharacterized protein n=1 Tax=Falsiroseomonas oleicola TaxID=2801474 RepID=A0ABS6H0E1_9PROT|nr:hypothetical protein [Roseomonas oleicola]MBU8542130.1 hypothetical protein [Roseomonas oleicola]
MLLQTPRNPLDSCALEVFREMTKSTGFAAAQRWANDLSVQAGGHDALALGGIFMLTSVIRVQVMQVHDDIRRSVQEALDLPGTVDAQTTFAAIRDGQSLCPAGLMGRLSELTLEA